MIVFEDKEYDVIHKFDCRVISLGALGTGKFLTVLPISRKGYRDDNPGMSKAEVTVKEYSLNTVFHITDDLGSRHVIAIGSEHKQEIKFAIDSARSEGLLVGVKEENKTQVDAFKAMHGDVLKLINEHAEEFRSVIDDFKTMLGRIPTGDELVWIASENAGRDLREESHD